MDFIVGMAGGVIGALTVFIVVGALAKRSYKKAQATVPKKEDESSLSKTIAELRKVNNDLAKLEHDKTLVTTALARVSEITQQQQMISNQLQQPSKNALHSRHKNALIGDYQKLDEEKTALLQKILDTGYDPTITAIDPDTNQQKQMKLSEFVNRDKTPQEPKTSAPPVTEESLLSDASKKGRRITAKETPHGTFYLIENEEDDKKTH